MKPTWSTPDGQVQLFLADCLQVLPTLAPGSVDAVVTDPPYGILNLENGDTLAIRKSPRANGSGKLKDRMINTADFSWDSKAPSRESLDRLRELGAAQIIWGANYFELPPTRCVLIWDKMQPWENFSQVELAWTSLDWPSQIFKWSKSNIPDKVHPTQKPDELMAWCLGYLPQANVVLDPFMGSGATGVACIRTGRRFIGIEIDERYFAIAVKRIEKALADDRAGLYVAAEKHEQAELFTEPKP